MYTITCTAEDNNGVRVANNTPQALGHAHRKTYATRAEAEAVAEDLADDLPAGYESCQYKVTEVDAR
jgi:hypothetical protein